jgi:tripartite-type tricarboxylate transporter receptor subunit TctC
MGDLLFEKCPVIGRSGPILCSSTWYIVAKANADIGRVLQMPDIKNNLAAQGIEAITSTPDALSTIIRDDYARWGKVIRDADIKAD